MKAVVVVGIVAAAALGGCNKKTEEMPAADALFGGGKGRYAGAGQYVPGRMWEQITREAATDPAAANAKDDEQVIVVVDTRTGEVRQCGNLSGYCISMNPWAELPASRRLPATMTKHEADLEAEAEAALKAASR